MRRLVILAAILIFLCIAGYFIYMNNHKVPLVLMGAYTLHLSLWLIVFAVFLFGWLLAWIHQVLFHPDRLFQRIKNRLARFQDTKREKKRKTYYDASLRYDLKAMRAAFRSMQRSDRLPLHIRAHYLKQQRYQQSSASLMEAFHQLKQQYTGNLQVLLPYQKLALELQEWGLAELLSQEILDLEKEHPRGLEGLRQVHQHRQEWEKCAQQEVKLLTRFPQSMVAESLLFQHEIHLLKGYEQNPRLISQKNLNHFPGKASAFKEFHQVTLALVEAEQLCRSQQYEQAARLLKRTYEKTAAPVLLDRLESIFYQTGHSEKVSSIFRDLQLSSSATLYVDLVRARIHYRLNQFDQARSILSRLATRHPKPPVFYHILDYLLAKQESNQEQLIETAQSLIPAKTLLANLYSCKQCGAVGDWQSVCHRCNHVYSYVHRDHLT